MSGVLETRKVLQVAFVVHDIVATTKKYCEFFGMEDPGYMVAGPSNSTRFKGEPTECSAKLAFFNMENIQIELIEPDHHPSTWREWLDKNGEGFHHLAFKVDDFDGKVAALNKSGAPTLHIGNNYGYFDTVEELKFMVELLG